MRFSAPDGRPTQLPKIGELMPGGTDRLLLLGDYGCNSCLDFRVIPRWFLRAFGDVG